ncbi:DUF4097 family beta strand repeat-containing protein [Streptomyces sp. NPDC050856]|uniref:DUF4097 family beta strand repeat-containing protein n=1 Tax=Streptomyces sp. NPDC050856 TaxID=3154939 RepID=UPI0033CD5AFD
MAVPKRRRSRTFVFAVGASVLVGLVTGCGNTDVAGAPVERKAFPFSGATLTIDADDSELVVVPADVKDVRVARQVDGWVAFGEGPVPHWKLEDGRLTLGVTCKALAGDCRARHEVEVPRGVAVTAEDDNGDVTADGFATALKVTSDNGRVTVRNSSGPLDLRSDNGEIAVTRSTPKRVVARADNGEVSLALGAAPDRVDTVSDNGAVTIELPAGAAYAVDAESGNGEVDVDVATDPRSAHVVNARSDNGEVTVRGAN